MKKVISVLVAILGFAFVSMAQVKGEYGRNYDRNYDYSYDKEYASKACAGKKEYDACLKKDGTEGQCKIVNSNKTKDITTVTTRTSETNGIGGNLSIGVKFEKGTLGSTLGGALNGGGNISNSTTKETERQTVPIVIETETGLECR